MKEFDLEKEKRKYIILFVLVLLLPFLVGYIMTILAMIL